MNESDFASLALDARDQVPPSAARTAEILQVAHRSARRRRGGMLVGLAATVAVLAGAAGLTLPEPDRRDDAPQLVGPATMLSGSWLLTSGTADGEALQLQPDYPVTLSVHRQDGRLTVQGQAACNTYGSEVQVDAPDLTVGGVSSTQMGCVEPVQSLEQAFLLALSKVTTYDQTPDRLVLDGPEVELVFEPLPQVPTAELVDTVWQLESIATGGVATSVEGSATLLLRSDGTFTMSSGCGLVLTGEWTESNGTITYTRSSASGGCQQHPQSQAVLAASDSFYAVIDGDRLRITGRHGGELLYVRPSAPSSAAGVVGTDWLLTAIADGPGTLAPTGDPTLRLSSDGTYEFSTGCGTTLTGRWTERGAMIGFTRSRTLGTCSTVSEQSDLIDDGFRGDLLVQTTDEGLSVIAANRELEFVAR